MSAQPASDGAGQPATTPQPRPIPPARPSDERWPRFGQGAAQTLHPDVADALLSLLFAREPHTFARLHFEAIGGEPFSVSRGARGNERGRKGGQSRDS